MKLTLPFAIRSCRLGWPCLLVLFLGSAPSASAATIAYWRFEGDGANSPTNGMFVRDTNGRTAVQSAAGLPVLDVSGNGNTLFTWNDNITGHQYSTNVPGPIIPQTGMANNWSILTNGGAPATFTWSRESSPTTDIETIKPLAWTIEASIYATAQNGHRTFVGRDGNGVSTANASRAPLYFKTFNGALGIEFADEAGNFYQLYDPATMASNKWYNVAAVSDGVTVKLFRDSGSGYQQVGSQTLTGADRRLAYDDNGSATVGDTNWGWTIGRGRFGTSDLQGDNHTDRWFGYVDEVRISDVALGATQFLFAVQSLVNPTEAVKADNTDALNLASSWVGGAIPTNANIAVWDATVTGPNSVSLGSNAMWGGVAIRNPGGDVVINPGNLLAIGGAGIDMSAATVNLTLSNNVLVFPGAPQSWNVDTNRTNTVAGTVGINGPIVKQGNGNLILQSANSGGGGLSLNAGVLTLDHSNAAGGLGGSNTLTLNSGILRLNADPAAGINTVIAGPVTISMGANRRIGGNSTTTFISGNGPLTFIGLNSGRVFTLAGAMSGFTGTIDLGENPASLRFNDTLNTAFGNANATFNLGTNTGTLVNRNGGGTFHLGALLGGPLTVLSGRSSGTGGAGSIYSIGGKGTSTTFAGTITNGGDTVSIIKVGSGKLTLSGTNSYTGTTAINAGTLQVDGALNGAGAVSVGAGATLSGNGLINGATIVSGILAPGASIGTLTFSNTLTFSGIATATFELSTSAGGGNDQILVAGNLALTSNNKIRIDAVSDAVDLEATDYTLFVVSGSTTMTGTPGLLWDGIRPNNYRHYTPTNNGNNVILKYVPVIPPLITDLVAIPSSLPRNQSTRIVARTEPGNGTITNVTVDLTQIGGPANASLVLSNDFVYTNTFVVSADITTGFKTLPVLVEDSSSLTATNSIALSVLAADQLWDGGGADDNWSSNTNWASNAGPGLVGDSVTFGGSTRLAPNMDASYSVTGVTFDGSASSFTIGTTNDISLTLSGFGIFNYSTNPQTLNVPITFNASQQFIAQEGDLTLGQNINNNGFAVTMPGNSNTTFLGEISGSGSVNQSGFGELTLAGNNTFSGLLSLRQGRTSLIGSMSNVLSRLWVGHGGLTRAIFIVSGNITADRLASPTATPGAGATYQSGGSVSLMQTAGDANFSLGGLSVTEFPGAAGAGGYGYYKLSGGALSSSNMTIGARCTNSVGMMEVAGGVVSVDKISLGRGDLAPRPSLGVLHVSGGFVNFGVTDATSLIEMGHVTGGVSELHVGGGEASATVTGGNHAAGGIDMARLANSAHTRLNLLPDGILTTPRVFGSFANPVTTFGFNGGTLKATPVNAGVDFFSDTDVDNVYVYANGGTVDNNGQDITIARPLQSPIGNGVNSISSFSGGDGYIGAPVVLINRGAGDTTGVGASAIARIDSSTGNPTSGQLTNIVITSPGAGFTAIPIITLSGGGALTPATITAAAPTANSSGGMTFTGPGITRLSGTSTYTGLTLVNSGTVLVSGAIASPVSVAAGATLGGTGTIGGVVTLTPGGILSPGASIGTLTLSNSPALAGTLLVEINTTNSPATNDLLVVSGYPLAFGGVLTVTNTGPALGLGDSFDLLDFDSASGSFTAANLPALADGLEWDLSSLSSNGVISVVQASTGTPNISPLVANPIPDQTSAYGSAFSFTFAANTFSDPDAGQTLSYGASGLPPGISFDGPTRTFNGTNTSVGTFPITVTATDNGTPAMNTNDTFELIVERALLAVTADNQSRGYGETNPPLSFSYSGFVVGETEVVLDTPPSAQTSATNGSPVGTYPIPLAGGTDDHYSFGYSNGTLTVTTAPLTVTASSTNRVQGAANPPLTGSLTGIVWGDNITANFITIATPVSPPGTYPISPEFLDSDFRLGNYSITTNLGTLTILAPPAITLTTTGDVGLLALTWPSMPGGFELEATATLTLPAWLTISNGITESGGLNSYVVTNDFITSGRFFRLRLP